MNAVRAYYAAVGSSGHRHLTTACALFTPRARKQRWGTKSASSCVTALRAQLSRVSPPLVAPSPRLRLDHVTETSALVGVLNVRAPVAFKLRKIDGGWYIDS
jgi:hypothetical protein